MVLTKVNAARNYKSIAVLCVCRVCVWGGVVPLCNNSKQRGNDVRVKGGNKQELLMKTQTRCSEGRRFS